jgi:hypothetical protein
VNTFFLGVSFSVESICLRSEISSFPSKTLPFPSKFSFPSLWLLSNFWIPSHSPDALQEKQKNPLKWLSFSTLSNELYSRLHPSDVFGPLAWQLPEIVVHHNTKSLNSGIKIRHEDGVSDLYGVLDSLPYGSFYVRIFFGSSSFPSFVLPLRPLTPSPKL